ncbi:MAG TPA: hypothetical protein GX690_02665 [Tenericutes bacterium]|nr:hypothetical protein [Mycoplasmatota bacterium]
MKRLMELIDISELKNTDIIIRHKIPFFITIVNIFMLFMFVFIICFLTIKKIEKNINLIGVATKNNDEAIIKFTLSQTDFKKISKDSKIVIIHEFGNIEVSIEKSYLELTEKDGIITNIGIIETKPIKNENILNNELVRGKIVVKRNSIIKEIFNFLERKEEK